MRICRRKLLFSAIVARADAPAWLGSSSQHHGARIPHCACLLVSHPRVGEGGVSVQHQEGRSEVRAGVGGNVLDFGWGSEHRWQPAPRLHA